VGRALCSADSGDEDIHLTFAETEIKGAFVIEPSLLKDERGFFARTWCQREFEEHRLNPKVVQCNISFNRKRGTVRGMHYQAPPYEEARLVRCTSGAIYDVIVDLRGDSAGYLRHFGVILSAENRKMLYVPEGCAHGFQTLEDNTEIFYQMSEFHNAKAARGLRWNDPALAIRWPEPVQVISEKDRSYADLDARAHGNCDSGRH
jgi:dTDP-4-dehydrorhamnose 3,5-epimerase